MSGICRNCGGPEGLHHYATMQCPLNGREAPMRDVVLRLADRIAELEESVASVQSSSELAESVSIWGAE